MENKVEELARPIKGYEGLYEVTPDGEVYSLNYNKTGRRVRLKAIKHDEGYLEVHLYKGGKMRRYLVHRLVAEAFIPNIDGKPQIDHINTIKSDNRVDNLRWVTSMENHHNQITEVVYQDAFKKRSQKPEWHKNTSKANIKRCAKAVYCIELDKVFESAHEAARQLGLSQGNISACCRGESKTTGGYHFRFA